LQRQVEYLTEVKKRSLAMVDIFIYTHKKSPATQRAVSRNGGSITAETAVRFCRFLLPPEVQWKPPLQAKPLLRCVPFERNAHWDTALERWHYDKK